MESVTLDKLSNGEYLRVVGINSDKFPRRLMELGISENAKIKKLFSPPWGEPSAYSVKGAVMALRSEDAKMIYGIKGTESEDLGRY